MDGPQWRSFIGLGDVFCKDFHCSFRVLFGRRYGDVFYSVQKFPWTKNGSPMEGIRLHSLSSSKFGTLLVMSLLTRGDVLSGRSGLQFRGLVVRSQSLVKV